ncbi:hypothetical protein [Lysinibacillus capsici]|uniref:hypothetical protein n=1 Tax=Lysinibacillus capsici TaxID=2115968 RepID=UPI0028AFE702|nr:hypothetical protein [Lysinibacillus capsici]
MTITKTTLSLTDTVDALVDIQEILEKAHYTQQLVEEKFFGRYDVKEDKSVQAGIIHDYHRYDVFNSIVSDNLYHAESLLKDLLHTVKISLQDS